MQVAITSSTANPSLCHITSPQAVMQASKNRFSIVSQSDPIDFWSWLLNTLHFDLTGGKPKAKSVITDCFQVITIASLAKPACSVKSIN